VFITVNKTTKAEDEKVTNMLKKMKLLSLMNLFDKSINAETK